jgi:hypothetical protein
MSLDGPYQGPVIGSGMETIDINSLSTKDEFIEVFKKVCPYFGELQETTYKKLFDASGNTFTKADISHFRTILNIMTKDRMEVFESLNKTDLAIFTQLYGYKTAKYMSKDD